jgi:hypothetical protein
MKMLSHYCRLQGCDLNPESPERQAEMVPPQPPRLLGL